MRTPYRGMTSALQGAARVFGVAPPTLLTAHDLARKADDRHSGRRCRADPIPGGWRHRVCSWSAIHTLAGVGLGGIEGQQQAAPDSPLGIVVHRTYAAETAGPGPLPKEILSETRGIVSFLKLHAPIPTRRVSIARLTILEPRIEWRTL